MKNKNRPSNLPVEIATQKRTPHSKNSGSCFDHSEKILSTNCQIVFDQMKVKWFLTDKQEIFRTTKLFLGLCRYKTLRNNLLSIR